MALFTEEEKTLRRIEKRFAKGVVEYGLIEEGDKILIGLSGGKDSLALVELLARRSRILKPGIDTLIARDLPYLHEHGAHIIVNVCGRSKEDYVEVVERLADEDVDMLEINISCPNVKAGGIAFGQKPEMAEEITKAVKVVAKQPIVMKLSPNVTDITEMAKAVEAGGADGVSLINTLTGMKIDVARKTFALANQTGGMSGPCVKPVAVRMVYQVANAVSIPVLGMGGVQNTEDALEFLMAGATMVAVGTANFFNPYVTSQIIDGLEEYVKKEKLSSIRDIIGCVK